MSILTHLSLAAALTWLPGVAENPLQDARAERPVIGVTTSVPGPTLAAQLRLQPGEGLVLDEIVPGHPAAEAGLAAHDIVIAIDGRRPVDLDVLREAVLVHHQRGDELLVTVLRAGRPTEFSVGVTTREGDAAALEKAMLEAMLAADQESDARRAAESLMARAQLEKLVAEKQELARLAQDLEHSRSRALERSALVEQMAAERKAAELQLRDALKARDKQAEVEAAKQNLAALDAELARRSAELNDNEAQWSARMAELNASMAQLQQVEELKRARELQAREAANEEQLARRYVEVQAAQQLARARLEDAEGQRRRLVYEELAQRATGGPDAGSASDGALAARLDRIDERLARIEARMEELVESIR